MSGKPAKVCLISTSASVRGALPVLGSRLIRIHRTAPLLGRPAKITHRCRTVIEANANHAVGSIPNILRNTAYTVGCRAHRRVVAVHALRVRRRVAAALCRDGHAGDFTRLHSGVERIGPRLGQRVDVGRRLGVECGPG